jgi:cysteine synthase A
MVALARITPSNGVRIVAKCEWENPTGSMKDRMALAAIARAEQDGRLKPGGTVVEYTGGSTGASLALVCAAKGYRTRIVTSDAFAREKLDQMRAFGAELILVPSDGGKTTRKLINDMIEVARKLSAEPGTFWTDQLQNRDSIAGYHGLGEEIWMQSGGRVDAFVHCVGTSASIQGVAQALRKHNPKLRIVAVEPGESAVLSGGEAAPHNIEGVGIGRTPPMWDPAAIDEIIAVPTEDAKAMARRLAKEEALFAGTSSGANVIAALQVAERLVPSSTVATLLVDSGLKYTGTDVYRAGHGPAPT